MKLSADAKSWLLETLRDLAPAAVAERMIAAGVVDRDDMICGDVIRGATWIDESDRTDPHENMGSAVEGIVAELTAPDDEDDLERLGAMMSSWIGTNGDAESLGFTADEILTEWNALIDRRYPEGFGCLY